jgi:hypothetical protein
MSVVGLYRIRGTTMLYTKLNKKAFKKKMYLYKIYTRKRKRRRE